MAYDCWNFVKENRIRLILFENLKNARSLAHAYKSRLIFICSLLVQIFKARFRLLYSVIPHCLVNFVVIFLFYYLRPAALNHLVASALKSVSRNLQTEYLYQGDLKDLNRGYIIIWNKCTKNK